MAPEKRNHFLDADDSENNGSEGYDSDAKQVGKGGRGAKRRKVDRDSSDEEDYDGASDQEPTRDEEAEAPVTGKSSSSAPSKSEPQSAPTTASTAQPLAELPDVTRPLLKKNLVATDAAVRRSGVVYLSSIPPYMKPSKLRSLLEPYGTINRIFLSPEDPASRTRRVKSGGNKKKSYADGWVEFVRKNDAKKACELLNARNIGGKKGSYYRDDIWNLRYLTGFKWYVSHVLAPVEATAYLGPGTTSPNRSPPKPPSVPAGCGPRSPRRPRRTRSSSGTSSRPRRWTACRPRGPARRPGWTAERTRRPHQPSRNRSRG